MAYRTITAKIKQKYNFTFTQPLIITPFIVKIQEAWCLI